MFDIDPYTISVIIFFCFLAVLIYRDRKNIEFHYIVLIKKTKKGRRFIRRAAKLSPIFWKVFSSIGIIFCIYMMVTGFYSLILSVQLVIEKVIRIPAIQFVLPIPTPKVTTGLGFIGIPFWFWIVVVAVVMFPHEFSHGIIMVAEKVKIKSVGVILLTIFTSAFVEPNEMDFKKSKLVSKLRILTAGSLANFLVSFVLLYLTQLFIWPFFISNGLMISAVNATSPAGRIGLERGMIIQEINDKKMDISFLDYYQTYGGLLFLTSNMTVDDAMSLSAGMKLSSVLYKFEPGDNITLKVDDRSYVLTLTNHPRNASRPYMGVNVSLKAVKDSHTAFNVVFPLLTLCILLSYGVGLFNILPIYPFDGGLILESLTEDLDKKLSKMVVYGATMVCLSLIVFSFAGPLLIP